MPSDKHRANSADNAAGSPESILAETAGVPLEPPAARCGHPFATTHWSLVLQAAQSQVPEADRAMEQLCRTYWFPLYAFLRRQGCAPAEAEDLTQEFFAERVLTRRIFRGIDPLQGRFRSWLLNSLQHLRSNERDRRQAQKRGGAVPHIALDYSTAEGRLASEIATHESPEAAYDKAWALAAIDAALGALRQQYVADGKSAAFDELKCYLPGALSPRPYAETAASLGRTEDAVKVAVSRLRQEFGRALLAEIRRTVSAPEEIRAELTHLMTAIGR